MRGIYAWVCCVAGVCLCVHVCVLCVCLLAKTTLGMSCDSQCPVAGAIDNFANFLIALGLLLRSAWKWCRSVYHTANNFGVTVNDVHRERERERECDQCSSRGRARSRRHGRTLLASLWGPIWFLGLALYASVMTVCTWVRLEVSKIGVKSIPKYERFGRTIKAALKLPIRVGFYFWKSYSDERY